MHSRLFVLLLAACLVSCSNTTAPDERDVLYDNGERVEYYGIGIVTSIEPDDTPYDWCPERVRVRFAFVPFDTSVRSRYYYPWFEDEDIVLLVGDGRNPPVRWAKAMGITLRSVHRCTRIETYDWPGCVGECLPFPIVFDFPELDRTHYYEYCD